MTNKKESTKLHNYNMSENHFTRAPQINEKLQSVKKEGVFFSRLKSLRDKITGYIKQGPNSFKKLGSLVALTLTLNSTMPNVEAAQFQKQEKVQKTESVQPKQVSYINSKFGFTIPNVKSSEIKTGKIVNQYISNGVKHEGKFVVMPNGALFNLQGRSVKITSKNIYAIENDRSGYFNLNDLKTKKIKTGNKISIKNGEIIEVPDTPTKPNKINKMVNKTIAKPTEVYGPIYQPYGPYEKKATVKTPEKATPKIEISNERISNPIKVKYFDPSTGEFHNGEISLKVNVLKIERLLRNDKSGKFDSVEHGIIFANKIYSGIFNRVTDRIEFYPYDNTKPESITNKTPLGQVSDPILLKADYYGKTAYIRFDAKRGKAVLESLNNKGEAYFDLSERNYGRDYKKSNYKDNILDGNHLIKDKDGNLKLKNN